MQDNKPSSSPTSKEMIQGNVHSNVSSSSLGDDGVVEDSSRIGTHVTNGVHFADDESTTRPMLPLEISGSASVGGSVCTMDFADALSEEDEILKAEMNELKAQYELQGNRLKLVENTVKQLRHQLQDVQRQRDASQLLYKEREAAMESLRTKASMVSGLDESLKTAIGEIDRLKKAQNHHADNGDKGSETEKLRLKAQVLEGELNHVKEKSANERADHERIRTELELELERMLTKALSQKEAKGTAELIARNEELERLLEAAQSDVSRLTENVVKLESGKQLLKREFVKMKEDVREATEQFLQIKSTLESRLDKKKAELVQVQFDLVQVKDSLEATQKENELIREEAQAAIKKVQLELSSTIDEREKLQISLSPQVQVSAAVAAAIEPRDKLIKELKQQVAQLTQDSKTSSDGQNWLNARLKVFKEESALLERKLFDLERENEHQLRVTKTECSNAKTESLRLSQKLDSLDKENETLRHQVEQLRDHLGKTRQEKAKTQAILSILEKKLHETEAKLRSSTDYISELTTQLETAKATILTQNQLLFGSNGGNRSDDSDDALQPISNKENGTDDSLQDEFQRQMHSNDEKDVSYEKADVLVDIANLDDVPNKDDDRVNQTATSPNASFNQDAESPATPRGRTHSLDYFEENVRSWPHTWHENDGQSTYGGRDLVGFGLNPPKPMWPNMAKVALNFTIHFEEGSEMCLLHGDAASESQLTENIGTQSLEGRDLNSESMYDYGARAGFWRLHRLFVSKKITPTVFAAGMALERNIDACQAMKQAGWEVASHGYRRINYGNLDAKTQLDQIKRTIAIHKKLLGDAPAGIHLGNPSDNTRRIVAQKFYYDSDSYSDDLPFWTLENGSPHLVIPLTMTQNDIRFVTSNGFTTGQDFCRNLTETLDMYIAEGRAGRPRMMSVALHCRIVGRPGRTHGLAQFMDYAKGLGSEVWMCTREDIARYWYESYYPKGLGTPTGKNAVH